MSKSLLEQLPGIVAAGKRQAAQILEQLEGRNRVSLQTRELVIPSGDRSRFDLRITGDDGVDSAPNRLIYGDNLLAMAALLAGDENTGSLRGKIDLIYIDPPFDSKADYRTKIALPGTTVDQKPAVLEQFAYSDTWADGTASYLAMMVPRLVLMKELLSEQGSFFLHLDGKVGHYAKVVMDDIFGRQNYRNCITWQRDPTGKGAKRTSKSLPNEYDLIFFYSKGDGYTFEQPFRELSEKQKSVYSKIEQGTGRRFKTVTLGDYSRDSIDRMESEGLIYTTSTGSKYKKYYLDEGRDVVGSIWSDIIVSTGRKAKESVGYNTQKPLQLLRRIIEMACPPGGLIFDCFAGSGTTLVAAEELGRRWIGVDLGKPATMIMRKRLIDIDANPFLYQAIGDYQVEQARSTLGRSFRVGDLAKVVLDLFGALPLPSEENVNGSLGRLSGTRTLVYADSPSRLTTISTLKRAQGYREVKMGGFDKVIVLGWNFAAGIGQDITDLNDLNLEVLVIPPDLLDRLRKKGADKLASKVRFSSLQYLKADVSARQIDAEHDSLVVNLQNYVLLSPQAINLDQANRAKLQDVMNTEPLALIEYWAVDPDYDGEVFRSVWQDYRGNTENDGDELRVVTTAELDLPRRERPRTVCVRAVDVFGFESEVVISNVGAQA